MSVRYSTPHVHYPQLNSSRVCLPTNFQKFKCHIFICVCVCQYLWIISFWGGYIEKKGDMRGSEPEIPNLKTWNHEFLNLNKNAIPTSRNLNEEFLDPEFPNLKRPDPGVPEERSYPTSFSGGWGVNLGVGFTFCFQFEFMSDAGIVRNINYLKRNSMFFIFVDNQHQRMYTPSSAG